MSPDPSHAAFDFAAALGALRQGRAPWPEVELPLRAALDGGAALCVVQGPAGSGKSSLLAALLAQRPALHHLLRDGALAQRWWSDAHALLLSLGFQLRALTGLRDEAPTLRITQEMAQLDGSLSGGRIGRLIASPWALPQLQLTQRVAAGRAQVQGLQIDEWIGAYQVLPLAQFAEMALWAPLRRWRAQQPQGRLCLCLDAFDADPQALLGWLPKPAELRQLGGLQLLLLSRPHADLAPWCEAADWALDLGESASLPARQALGRRLIDAAGAAAQTEAWLAASEASPLYLSLALREGRAPDELPQGLAALQRAWLLELEGQCAAAPQLLRLLARANRPWPAPWLAQAAGLDTDTAQAALAAARPWLREAGAQGWQLAQRSSQEGLAEGAQAGAEHAALLQVIAAQPEPALDASWLDAWVWHATQANDAAQQRWLAALDAPWWRQRLQAQGHLLGLQADLARAWPLARDEATRMRLLALGALAVAAEEALPPELLPLLARERGPQAALQALGRGLESGVALARCRALAQDWFRDEATHALAWAAWREGLAELRQAAARDADAGHLVETLLQGLPTALAVHLSPDECEALREVVRGTPASWRRPPALIELARVFAARDAEEGEAWFELAFDDLRANLRSSFAQMQTRWLQARLAWRASDAAALLGRGQWGAQAHSVRGVLVIARALQADGGADALAQLGPQLQQRMADWEDPSERALGEALLAEAWAEQGETAQAQAALARSDAARAQIGTAADTAAAQQQRPRQVTDALCAAAQAAVALQSEDADLRLEAGWAAWQSTGAFAARAQDWVALQARAQPALLPVYLAHTAPELQRAALLLGLAPPELLRTHWQAALAMPGPAELPQDRPPWYAPPQGEDLAAQRSAWLAQAEPVLAPNEALFVVPGPGVPWIVSAGLSMRQAALLGCACVLRDGALPEGEAPALRALALAWAPSAEGPARRLRALDAAWALAEQVEPPWLRAPVQAAVLAGLARLGVQAPVRERADACLQRWTQALAVSGRGDLPCAGYGLALGTLAAVRVQGLRDDAPLWQAHALGERGAAAAWAAWRWARP